MTNEFDNNENVIDTPVDEMEDAVQGPVIRVARVTDGMKEIPFTPGMTVSQAIELAGFGVEGEDQVRLNNELVSDLDTVVPEDGTILILQKITGN